MLVGVPKEIKVHEYRVGLAPDSVREICRPPPPGGRRDQAGARIGRSNDDYRMNGAEIAGAAKDVFERAEMI